MFHKHLYFVQKYGVPIHNFNQNGTRGTSYLKVRNLFVVVLIYKMKLDDVPHCSASLVAVVLYHHRVIGPPFVRVCL